MNKIIVSLVAILGLLNSGCVIVAKLGTPTRSEKIIDAEFMLAEHDYGKIAIVVRGQNKNMESERLGSNIYIATKASLINNKLITSEDLIRDRFYKDYKNSVANFNELSLRQIAETLNVDTILEITIDKYKLTNMAGTNYYEGSIKLGGSLYSLEQDMVIWPEDGFSKQVSLGFDIDSNGHEAAMKRLAVKGSHCITRYLYNCPLPNFKVSEESTGQQW